MRQVHAQRMANRGCRQRIAHVVAAGHRQFHGGLALRRDQQETAAIVGQRDVTCAHIRAVIQAEAHHVVRTCTLHEVRREAVVGIHHRDAAVAQVVIDRGLGVGDLQQAAHALQMRGRHVVDQANIRRRNRGEIGDVARCAGAHLVDREACIFRRIQHRQRHADFVVAVAGRGIGLARLRQHRFGQRLDAGLAIAAGDRDHAGITTRALHCSRKCRQCTPGVVDDDLAHIGTSLMRHQHGHTATRNRLRNMRMAVEILALQCHEQRRAGARQRARIGGHGIDQTVTAQQAATGGLRDPCERARRHAPCLRSASRATSASTNG